MTNQHNDLRGEAEKIIDSLKQHSGIDYYYKGEIIEMMLKFIESPAVSNFHKQTVETKSGEGLAEKTRDVEIWFRVIEDRLEFLKESENIALNNGYSDESERYKYAYNNLFEYSQKVYSSYLSLKEYAQTRNDELTASLEKAMKRVGEHEKENERLKARIKELEAPKNLEELRKKFSSFYKSECKNAPQANGFLPEENNLWNFFEKHLSTLDTKRWVSDEEIEQMAFEKFGHNSVSNSYKNWVIGAKDLRDKLSPHTGESEAVTKPKSKNHEDGDFSYLCENEYCRCRQ